MRRIPALVLVTVLLTGVLLSAITSIAVVVALRESVAPAVGPVAAIAAGRLVREMLLWAFITWTPLGALLGWWAGRRIAEPLEETRNFARDQAWSEHPPRRTRARIVEVKRLEEALSGYFTDLRYELQAAL